MDVETEEEPKFDREGGMGEREGLEPSTIDPALLAALLVARDPVLDDFEKGLEVTTRALDVL